MVRRLFIVISAIVLLIIGLGAYYSVFALLALFIVLPLIGLGMYDALQREQSGGKPVGF